MAELCFYTGASLHQFWIQHQAVCPPLASLALAMLSAPACFIGSSYVISISIISIHGMYILALWSADSWKTKLSEKEPGNESLHRPAPVALLVVSRYALPGYGNQRVWVRGPGWPDHCVRL